MVYQRMNPKRKMLDYYGCVKCQVHHYEDEEIFQPHLLSQSKHGVKSMNALTVYELREGRMHQRDIQHRRTYNMESVPR